MVLCFNDLDVNLEVVEFGLCSVVVGESDVKSEHLRLDVVGKSCYSLLYLLVRSECDVDAVGDFEACLLAEVLYTRDKLGCPTLIAELVVEFKLKSDS